MSTALFLLGSALCAFSAIAGWFAGRFTLDQPPTKLSLTRKPSIANHKTLTGKTFAAVVRFPEFDSFRHSPDNDKANEAVARAARSIAGKVPGVLVNRLRIGGLECVVTAGSEDEATDLIHEVIDNLLSDKTEHEDKRFSNPRTGLIEADTFPVSQSCFEAALTQSYRQKDQRKQQSKRQVSQPIDGQCSSDDILQQLSAELREGAGELAYQPKLDVRNQTFTTAEALFRWDSAKSHQFTIGEVIDTAEQSGAISEFTLWTLRRAVSDQLALIDQAIDLTTFVNLSGALISDSEFTLKAIEIIKSVPGKIGVEITETSVIEHAGNALSNLELYRAAGAEIAIDDYGTGLSSLRYLKQIPAQELKIDREFIKDLTQSHRDPMIVRSTIDLAHALGLTVTAEGVDDATKMALLKVMGCDKLQGFHIAKPMPLTELIEFMGDQERQESLFNSEVSLLPTASASRDG